jgi:hypothetical protein
MDAIVEEIVPEGRWEDFETYWSCCGWGREKYLGKKTARNAMYKQNSLPIFWTAEALLAAYRARGGIWSGDGAERRDRGQGVCFGRRVRAGAREGSADGGEEEFDFAAVSFDDHVDAGGALPGGGVLADDLPEFLSGAAAGEGLSGDVGEAVALLESHCIVGQFDAFDHAIFPAGDESGAGEAFDVCGANGQARSRIGAGGTHCLNEPGGG